jgi:tRNA pseudouridine32 synthase/23S rRNA pseudouridine746 synthase
LHFTSSAASSESTSHKSVTTKNQRIFDFKADLSSIAMPKRLNNPFGTDIPEVARIAAEEFQNFIAKESKGWDYNFAELNGKMFGILVVQKSDESYGYLGTNSGRTAQDESCQQFVPSIFDDAADDYFIDKGMAALAEITSEINATSNTLEIKALKEKRKKKSIGLQEQLFSHYDFLSIAGKVQNIVEVFENASHGKPPSAAGECAAPKLLQYAFENELKPIALAEFWWGKSLKKKERAHKVFYPACKNKCRPILEYMLDDTGLYDRANPSLT